MRSSTYGEYEMHTKAYITKTREEMPDPGPPMMMGDDAALHDIWTARAPASHTVHEEHNNM